MVHALREAWRVLRPDSLLLDLRPAIEHGRVGLIRDGRFMIHWAMRESLVPYRAASRSLTIAKDLRLFGSRSSSRFPCTMVFPAAEDVNDWLRDWYEPESFRHADNLVIRIEKAAGRPELSGVIAARVPFMLKVLAKRNKSPLVEQVAQG